MSLRGERNGNSRAGRQTSKSDLCKIIWEIEAKREGYCDTGGGSVMMHRIVSGNV
jgi:hypothetical protein